MKLVFRIFLVFAVLTSTVFASEYKPAERNAVEFIERDGLPNFFKKAKAGKEITIVYFGGSITAQQGWRLQSETYFKKRFPNANFKAIHSAIGGTGSLLGTFRVQRDVIAYNPDLVFIEFAVNDSGQKPANIRNTMEGLIRQIWKANPKTDICFVYTVTDNERNLPPLLKGKMYESETVMEDIADHYKIPSINFGVEIAKLVNENKLIMKAPGGVMTAVAGDILNEDAIKLKDNQGRIIFAKDGVHPYPSTGHILYTRTLIKSFEKMENKKHPVKHKLVAPLSADNFERATRIDSTDSRIKYSGNVKDANFKHFKRSIDSLKDMQVNSSMKFKVKSKSLFVFHVMGQHGAEIEVYIDGKKHSTFRTVDKHSTWARLQITRLFDLPEEKIREVELRVSDKKLNKRNFLSEANKKHFDKHPAEYDAYIFKPSCIMFVGEILD
ncbi:MAG: SGNH/GDSL hydrolase family protein [Opitutales bacterium]|nr:SGNH/GDSL hydrolase family protein [Opitutales bacterium]